jgi:hypothetical protein
MFFYICPTVPPAVSKEISDMLSGSGHAVSTSAIGASWFITTMCVRVRKVSRPFGVPASQLIMLAEYAHSVPPNVVGFHIGELTCLNGDEQPFRDWARCVSDPLDDI